MDFFSFRLGEILGLYHYFPFIKLVHQSGSIRHFLALITFRNDVTKIFYFFIVLLSSIRKVSHNNLFMIERFLFLGYSLIAIYIHTI